jgi:hypothetical protein
MVIISITEEQNKEIPKVKPVKEVMNIFLDGVPDGIPNRNGFISVFTGSGGSGKTSLLLNMFKSKALYRGKFHNVFYIAPMASYLSVQNHPFKDHDKVYHELTVELLEAIYNQLLAAKEESEQDEDAEPEYSCVIIDDFAATLKQKDVQRQLNQMLIKARHIQCSFIFTLQSYLYFPLMLRKQLTNAIIFKPKNKKEMEALCFELVNLNKDDALKLFNYVFNEPYAHLDIDTVSNKLYKNFNLLNIEEN